MTITRIGKSNEEHVRDLMSQVERGMSKGVKAINADAKATVGVDTGRLRSSLFDETSISGTSVIGAVGSDVEYAFFHSLQNPYLESAVDRNLQFLLMSIASEVGK